jgi:hypothetical protein
MNVLDKNRVNAVRFDRWNGPSSRVGDQALFLSF